MASSSRKAWILLFLATLLCIVAFSSRSPCCHASETAEEGSDLHSLNDLQEDPDVADSKDSNPQGGDESDEFDEEEEEDEDFSDDSQIDESDVVVLGTGNFTAFLEANTYVLVEFYAPWCGHCQALMPEWAQAASELKGVVPLAKVDATQHDELGSKYGVQGYPTILFFIDGVNKPYKGLRTRDEIVKWVKSKMGPAVVTISSISEAEPLLTSDATIAVAYLENPKGTEAEELTLAARQEEAVMFYMTSQMDVAQMFSLELEKNPSLVLLKKQHEKHLLFDGVFERKAIRDFVFANKLPLIISFNKETAPQIFESDIKKQVLLFAVHEEYERLGPMYEEVSRSFRGQIIFIHVNLSDTESTGILDFFGISGDSTSIMAFTGEQHGPKFLYEDEISVEGLKMFCKNFLASKLKAYMKSQPIPHQNDDDVKIVVGKNFEDIVLDESKDTLLELYAPWCGHCQALEPVYNKLGKRLRGIDSIVIAKMDAIANEHPRAKSDGYPTILFFPAGQKSFDPVTFDGERTVKGFYQFLKRNAAIPFSLPKPSQSQQNSPAAPVSATIEKTSSGEQLKDEL
ncbi:unnamed protein product [Sphagnum jensenii]|uniref:protein disulfide-isomerase n=1 Tax=Sphagnum jensenii TaxID=128206 RepID=A0ABP0X669_9BRYO